MCNLTDAEIREYIEQDGGSFVARWRPDKNDSSVGEAVSYAKGEGWLHTTYSRPDASPAKSILIELCKECRWSFYQLSKQTGLDKKLVLGHCKGKGFSLQTRKIYEDAFSKELGRKISIPE